MLWVCGEGQADDAEKEKEFVRVFCASIPTLLVVAWYCDSVS